jgi:hypothetical protein
VIKENKAINSKAMSTGPMPVEGHFERPTGDEQ